jgi:hypothetical protein
MHSSKILLVLFLFCSCNNSSTTNINCIKIKLKEDDFIKINFSSLPNEVRNNIIKLATIDRKMDTVLSLEKDITYTYYNPGAGKGYTEQVLKDKEMHTINGKCYEFLLYSMPYIIYDDKIFSFEQGLGTNCAMVPCVPDTIGINETILYALPLDRILKK